MNKYTILGYALKIHSFLILHRNVNDTYDDEDKCCFETYSWHIYKHLRYKLSYIVKNLNNLVLSKDLKTLVLKLILQNHNYDYFYRTKNDNFLIYSLEIECIVLEFNLNLTIYRVHVA